MQAFDLELSERGQEAFLRLAKSLPSVAQEMSSLAERLQKFAENLVTTPSYVVRPELALEELLWDLHEMGVSIKDPMAQSQVREVEMILKSFVVWRQKAADVDRGDTKESVGIFMRVPLVFALGFPTKPDDKSPAHATILHVGECSWDEYQRVVQVTRGFAASSPPFHVDVTDYGEFTNQKGQTIAHMIPRSHGMPLESIHEMLKQAVEATLGRPVGHFDGPLKPHITLAYLEPGKKYEGNRPSGGFVCDTLEVWGAPDGIFGRYPVKFMGGDVQKAFNTDEARDKGGKWTSGGGDASRRQAEREGNPVKVLADRVRRREISPERVEMAARLGHGVAQEVHGKKVEEFKWDNSRGTREDRAAALATLDPKTQVSFGADCVERALPVYDARDTSHPGGGPPHDALKIAREWQANSSEKSIQRLQREAAEAGDRAGDAATALEDSARVIMGSYEVDEQVKEDVIRQQTKAAEVAFAAANLAYSISSGGFSDGVADASIKAQEASSDRKGEGSWQKQRLAQYLLGEVSPSVKKSDLTTADLAQAGAITSGPPIKKPKKKKKGKKGILASTQESFPERKVEILAKAEGDDERTVLGVVLEPEMVDSQRDIYSESEIRRTAWSFFEKYQRFGLQHRFMTPGIAPLESYIAPSDFEINGHKVCKGSWVLRVRVTDESIWKDVKAGKLTGFSIGGSAIRMPEPISTGKP